MALLDEPIQLGDRVTLDPGFRRMLGVAYFGPQAGRQVVEVRSHALAAYCEQERRFIVGIERRSYGEIMAVQMPTTAPRLER